MIEKISTSQINNIPANKKPEEIKNTFENNNIPDKQVYGDFFQNKAFYGKDIVQIKPKTTMDNDLKVIFKKLEGLEGDDFAQTAYKELVKYMGLEDCAPAELTFEEKEGRPIASDYKWYENKVIVYRNYFDKASKAEKLGFIAHELTHCKQTTNILRTDAPNILQQYAFAIAASDFRAAMITNPQARLGFIKAQQAGNADEYAKIMIYRQAAGTYKELITVFKDVLKLPKHSVNSPDGQKAISDIKAQSVYNGADVNGWANCPLEKEAMDFERKIVKAFLNK